jgi:hypothetical protein
MEQATKNAIQIAIIENTKGEIFCKIKEHKKSVLCNRSGPENAN